MEEVGRDGELSLCADMIGSLISAQFCSGNATEQQTFCPKTKPCFAQSKMGYFSDGPVHLFSEHMSSQQVNWVGICTLKLFTRVQMVA